MPFRKSKPWGNQKPPVGTPIDQSNTLATKLCFDVPFNENAGKRPKDSARGRTGIAQAGATDWFPGPYGLGLKGDTANAAAIWSIPQITTSDGVGGGDFTMLVAGNPGASATRLCLFNQGVASGSFNLAQLCANQDSSGAASSGALTFITYNAGYAGVSAAGTVDGKSHVWVGVRQGSNMSLYRDGVIVAGPTGITVKNIWTATSQMVIGSDTLNSLYSACRQDRAMAWNRALLPKEVWSISKELYQVYLPPRRRIISAISVAGAVVKSRYYYDMIAGRPVSV